MLGRSISPWKQHADQYEDHFLLKEFDMVRWVPMTESEFSVVSSQRLMDIVKHLTASLSTSYRVENVVFRSRKPRSALQR